TDLHEAKELALDLAEAGDADRADALAALADEALSGMNRIRDVVKDLAVFASVVDRRSLPSQGPIDVAASVRARVERFAGKAQFGISEGEPAWVAPGLAGEDELDALVGLLLRHAGGMEGAHRIAIERGPSVVVRIAAPAGDEEPSTDFALAV